MALALILDFSCFFTLDQWGHYGVFQQGQKHQGTHLGKAPLIQKRFNLDSGFWQRPSATWRDAQGLLHIQLQQGQPLQTAMLRNTPS